MVGVIRSSRSSRPLGTSKLRHDIIAVSSQTRHLVRRVTVVVRAWFAGQGGARVRRRRTRRNENSKLGAVVPRALSRSLSGTALHLLVGSYSPTTCWQIFFRFSGSVTLLRSSLLLVGDRHDCQTRHSTHSNLLHYLLWCRIALHGAAVSCNFLCRSVASDYTALVSFCTFGAPI